METEDTQQNNLSVAHIATQQEKLDAIFGITGGKSVDEFLDDLKLDADQISSTVDQIDDTVKNEIQRLDNIQLDIKNNDGDVTLNLASMDKSLASIEDMVELSKDVIRHVAQSILATPLIDSEAVQAYSKLIESIHVNIAEFIQVYREKQNFVNKIKFSIFQQEQKKEFALFKHNLDLEKIKAKDGPTPIDPDDVSTRPWNQEQLTKFLSEHADELQ